MTAVRNKLFQAGDQVLESGPYLAHHVGIHCGWPEAMLEADNVFPACPTCGDNVRYALGRTAAGSVGEVGSPANRRGPFHTEGVNPLIRLSPGKQYLHLTAYRCDQCRGPVVAGSLGTRETAIERETQVSLLGGICLACGNRQDHLPDAGTTRGFMPVEWA
jgi:RNase P subunit RPR2